MKKTDIKQYITSEERVLIQEEAVGEVLIVEAVKAQQALAILTQHYPKVFDINNPRLLKIDIHKDLREKREKIGITEEQINQALRFFVRQPKYIEQYQPGAKRIDLNGEECDTVSTDKLKKSVFIKQHKRPVARVDPLKVRELELKKIRERVMKAKKYCS